MLKVQENIKKTKAHNRRQERPSSGELLQVDGTPHQFFYGDDKEYCLHGFIDDATHQVTGLYMCENECMHGYLEVTRQTFKNFGVPLALYADGSSIFFSLFSFVDISIIFVYTSPPFCVNALNWLISSIPFSLHTFASVLNLSDNI